MYYNEIYGNRADLNDVYSYSYKYFPTYYTSSRKGQHDWTYSYYNTRYKAPVKLYTTSYSTTTKNYWDADTDTPYVITETTYTYNNGVKKCSEKLVRNCSIKEKTNLKGENICTG